MKLYMCQVLKMKGLALNVIWSIVIAIASVLLFLGIITGTLKNAANWFYCDIYIKIMNFFSGSGMASIPESCKSVVKGSVKTEVVNDEDNKIFSRKLLAYVIACWNEAEIKGLYESHPCYELRLLGNVENVSEKNVSDILLNEDHCKSIENADYGCGAKDQILWSVDGEIISLTKNNISESVNKLTNPKEIPVSEDMIPSIDNIKTKIQLKDFLSKAVPDSICKSLGSKCSYWKFSKTSGDVWFKITEDEKSRIYSYNIDRITFYLESSGIVKSEINKQKILLIEYNGERDCVEVIG